MRENFKMLVRWWKFTKPNKLYFVLSFMSGMLFRILFYVVQPIFAAKIITSLTENDYKMAMIYLAVGTAVFILSYCIHHIKYVMHDKLMASTANAVCFCFAILHKTKKIPALCKDLLELFSEQSEALIGSSANAVCFCFAIRHKTKKSLHFARIYWS